MLDSRDGDRLGNMDARMVEELWKPVKWVVLFAFLLNWCAWFLRINRHWGTWDHLASVGFLLLSPLPCILMFFKREAYPPMTALLTYSLLGLAFGVAGN
jgi:hypothetical protein